jgi:hypothetical protein
MNQEANMMDDETPSKRTLQQLGSAVDRVVGELLERTSGATVEDLWSHWSDIAGPDWKATRPARLDDGALLVAVSDGTAATRLRYGVADLMGRINARVGDNAVTSIRLRIDRR